MMLSEVVAMGDPKFLALNDWGQDTLRYLALGNQGGTHVATAVFDRTTTVVKALEIFDPEGITWTWVDKDFVISLEGQRVDSVTALQSLSYLLKAENDPT
jgi:hypothetical protein